MKPSEFDDIANEIFQYQYRYNPIYQQFCDSITATAPWRKPPFYLPISAFKSNIVTTSASLPTFFFESSGTTGTINSRHYLKDVEFYLQMSMKGLKINMVAYQTTASWPFCPTTWRGNILLLSKW